MKIVNLKNGYFRSILFLLLTLSACAPNINHYPKINEYLLNQNYEAALSEEHKSKKNYVHRNRVLYYLDEGLLAQFAGHYEESNASLLKAEDIMADLYTRSISKEAASFLINDNTVSYRGEDFEAALVNLFLALNYFELGKLDEALVEARKVDSKLNSFNLQYPAGKKNVYKEDAFIRYIMGVMYLADGEINDAFISFSKAEQIYRSDYRPNYGVGPPQMLIEDLLWTAKKMNFMDEYEHYRKAYPKVDRCLKNRSSKEGQVYFIQYNGRGAEKVERNFIAPMPDGYVVRLAYPEFVKRAFKVDHIRISLNQIGNRKHYQFSTQVMEDISAIAKKNLKNRMGRIIAKAVARVTAKYLLAKKAEKKALKKGDKDLARFIRFSFQTYLIAVEAADIRHWRLLPAKIEVGRSFLPTGRYQGGIQLLDQNGTVIGSRPVAPFSLTAGETRLVILRTLE
jgi:uncharacterized protein